jgi:DNA-binding phage protein
MMQKRAKTGFDRYLGVRMKHAEFASEYVGARREIDAADKLVRALDQVRVAKGLTKAELARRISARPEIVRRLFTARSPNPTISSVISIASALGFHLTLVPNHVGSSGKRSTRIIRHRARALSSNTGAGRTSTQSSRNLPPEGRS